MINCVSGERFSEIDGNVDGTARRREGNTCKIRHIDADMAPQRFHRRAARAAIRSHLIEYDATLATVVFRLPYRSNCIDSICRRFVAELSLICCVHLSYNKLRATYPRQIRNESNESSFSQPAVYSSHAEESRRVSQFTPPDATRLTSSPVGWCELAISRIFLRHVRISKAQ